MGAHLGVVVMRRADRDERAAKPGPVPALPTERRREVELDVGAEAAPGGLGRRGRPGALAPRRTGASEGPCGEEQYEERARAQDRAVRDCATEASRSSTRSAGERFRRESPGAWRRV